MNLSLWTYNRRGLLMEITSPVESDGTDEAAEQRLRSAAVRYTKVHGQKGWWSVLLRDNRRVAIYRHGKWKTVTP